MKRILTILLAALCTLATAQNKKDLDIVVNHDEMNTRSFAKTTSYNSNEIKNNYISATLIEGGYFTLGTVSGLDESGLDDNCPLTYGHPYAMTSYPVFSIDSSWYTMDSFFAGMNNSVMHSAGDSLSLTLEIENLISLVFTISIEGDTYELNLQSTNLDTVAHRIGLGFVYDPTLGAGGDGALFVADQHIASETVFQQALSSIELWERSRSAKGLGVKIFFKDSAQVTAANWPDIYTADNPFVFNSEGRRLYDLALNMLWPQKEMDAGQQYSTAMQVNLQEADFSSPVFMRWDLPLFLSIEDNIMFPREFSSFMEISSIQNNYPNSYIKLEFPGAIYSDRDNYTLPIMQGVPSYQEIRMQSKISYEDKVVGITASIMQGEQVLDMYNRLVYVPATAISYAGLQIVNDSLSLANFPQTDLIFSLEREESGRKILDLTSENIVLFENDQRIEDFSFDKYTGGTSNLADVVFVLDVSGSMGDEINAVRDNLGEFADSLAARGFDYRIGIVTFSTRIDHTWDFTDNIDQIKSNLSSISLWGGVEDSPLALYTASGLSFRDGSTRTIIWITDEPYPEHSYTREQVVNRMLDMGIVVHGVGLNNLQTDWFNPIVIPTGGTFYDINGNFKDILLDVSRMGDQTRYLLSYQSRQTLESQEIKLEIHYAGLGVIKTYDAQSPAVVPQAPTRLICYPNPFNPVITFSIGSTDFSEGSLTVYNVLGQALKKFDLQPGVSSITWQAANDLQNPVSTGFYYVALRLVDPGGIVRQENSKILYLK